MSNESCDRKINIEFLETKRLVSGNTNEDLLENKQDFCKIEMED